MNSKLNKNHILQQLNVFMAIVDAGGITAASDRLGLSKAAISQRLRILEDALQTPLFLRTKRNMLLTDEGQLFLSQCQHLQSEIDAMMNVVSQIHTAPSGKLTISCNPSLADEMLLPTLNMYMESFPQVQVDLIVEERMPDMQKEKVDIVFAVNWSAPGDLIARNIGKTRYILAGSPEYFARFGFPKSIHELKHHRLIHHSGRGNRYLMDLKSDCMPVMTAYLNINHSSLIKSCALKGMGLIQLHDYKLKKEIADGTLIEVLKDYFNPAIPLYIYYQKHHFVQPKVRQFVNLLLKQLQ